MAASSQIVSLNLGAQTLSLARFELHPDQELVLSAYERREIRCDSLSESDRARRIGETLPGMWRAMGIKAGRVRYAVSSHLVFTRFVKLPLFDSEKIDRIIGFEAQQNVPFPIEEVIWDYQVVEPRADSTAEVVIVAVKTDLLEAINTAVEAAGFQTELVDVSSMALCNAFRYNYRELTACSLVIDIGARTTNLIFVEPGKLFSRTIPIGGNSITLSIAREFSESLEAAELRKKRDGHVHPGGNDAEMLRVSEIVGKTLTRLHAEITRSISFYRTQQGSQPELIFLAGGTAVTPQLKEFFAEKLQRPTEFLNPLRKVAYRGPVAEVAGSAHLLGELVGLALRSRTECRMQLSLRPSGVIRRQRLEKRRPFFILAAVCFVVGLLVWAGYFMHTAEVATQLADKMESDLDRMKGVERRLQQLSGEMSALDAAAEPLLRMIDDSGAWLRILEDLNARLPKENIWITELAPTSRGRVIEQFNPVANAIAVHPKPTTGNTRESQVAGKNERIIDGIFVKGLYLYNPRQQEVAIDYFRNLVASDVFEVSAERQSEVIRPSTPTNTEWAYPYELRLRLRRPFVLP